MSIHFHKYGKGSALVFFHGFGFDNQVWHSLIPHFKHKHTLYLVDLPGFGKTPMMDWEVFKHCLLEELPEQFSLVGWSMGGLFATRLALEMPDRTAQLINISSSPYFLKESDWPGIEHSALSGFYEKMVQHPMVTLKQFMALQTNTPVITPEAIPPGLEEGLNILMNWDLREKLRHYEKQVCYMFGRLDSIVPYKLMAIMKADYPNFRYHLFSRAAHAPFLSHQDRFITTLLECLE